MNVNNCRIHEHHEHLASSGKVKPQQDSKWCCFRNCGLPVGTEARTRQQCGRRPSLKRGESTDCSDPPSLHHTGPPHPFLECPWRCISKSFVRNSSLSYQDVCSPPPHVLVSMLFHYQICFRIFSPLPPLLNVVNFKVNIVLLSLALRSQWANGSSLLAMRKKVRERETVGESVCAAARWCAEYRTDLRPQATGRGLLYTPGTSLKAAAEEARCHWAASTADT